MMCHEDFASTHEQVSYTDFKLVRYAIDLELDFSALDSDFETVLVV